MLAHFKMNLLFCLFTLIGVVSGTEIEDQLLTDLLTGHNANVRPVENFTDLVTVTLSLTLNQILTLDERNQMIEIKVWMNYAWTDTHLTWNKSAYEGVEQTNIQPPNLWIPDITLYNELKLADESTFRRYAALIRHDGKVTWNIPNVIESSCGIDVRYFPFDYQICPLKFGSWAYHGFKLDLVNISNTGNIDRFEKNGQWELLGFPVVRHVEYYACCPEPYPDLTFYLVLKRKPMYFLYNLVLPCIFVLATAVLVFYLPPESGEKVSLGVTVLLALTVFLLLVADIMPPQSDTIPLIGQYFGATVILLAISTILTVLNMNVYSRGAIGQKVPRWLRKLALDWIARGVCLKGTVDANLPDNATISKVQVSNTPDVEELSVESRKDKFLQQPSSSPERPTEAQLLQQILAVLENQEDDRRSQKMDDTCALEWRMVSMVIDRFLLILFTVLTVGLSLGILLNRPTVSTEDLFSSLKEI